MPEKHTSAVRRDKPLCDFCCKEGAEITWVYHASEKVEAHVSTEEGDYKVTAMDDGWGACSECAELVEERDARGLARRAVSESAPEVAISLLSNWYRSVLNVIVKRERYDEKKHGGAGDRIGVSDDLEFLSRVMGT